MIYFNFDIWNYDRMIVCAEASVFTFIFSIFLIFIWKLLVFYKIDYHTQRAYVSFSYWFKLHFYIDKFESIDFGL